MTPPRSNPDARPDARPDAWSHPQPDTRLLPEPDAPPDVGRFRETGFDLRNDRYPYDVGIPDRPRDTPPDTPPFDTRLGWPEVFRDVVPDRRYDPLPDVKTDLPRDSTPDAIPGQPGDVLVRLDGPCARESTQPCVCENGLSGTRICLPSLVYSECGCGTEALMRVRNGMIGEWAGTATTPWLAPYQVTFTFDSYTHYSARSAGTSTPALYYGTDEDSPLKLYSVDDILANGNARGSIDIYFGPNNAVRNTLENIALSADLNQLKFSFMHSGQYGPLQYDLHRVIP